MGVVPQAGEDIERLPPIWRRIQDPVGRHQRQPACASQSHQQPVEMVFAATEVTLDFDKDTVVAKDTTESVQLVFRRYRVAADHRAVQRAFLVAAQRHQPGRKLRQFIPSDDALVLCRAQMGPGQQAAKIPITRPRLDQHGQNATIIHFQLRANDRPQAALARNAEESRRAINAHPIAQAQSQISAAGRHLGQPLRQRGTPEEAERAARMEFDVRRGFHQPGFFNPIMELRMTTLRHGFSPASLPRTSRRDF